MRKLLVLICLGILSLNATGKRLRVEQNHDYMNSDQTDKYPKLEMKSYENVEDFEGLLSDKYNQVIRLLFKQQTNVFSFLSFNEYPAIKAIFEDFQKYFIFAKEILYEINNCQNFIDNAEVEISKEYLFINQTKDRSLDDIEMIDYNLHVYELEKAKESLIAKKKLMSSCINGIDFYIYNIANLNY